MKPRPAPRPYTQTSSFNTILKGRPIRFISKPGLPEWDQVTPAAVLLTEHAALPPGSSVIQGTRLLVLGCGHGAMAARLAQEFPAAETWLMDNSTVAMGVAAQTMQANQVERARIAKGISLLPAGGETFDMVVMDAPKGRKLARRWLAEAHGLLRSGGALYLAGPNDQGIQPLIQDAEGLFGPGAILGYKKGNRVARLLKRSPGPPNPAWLSEPGIQPGTWLELELDMEGHRLHLCSLPGVFSSERVDEGTRLLLSYLETPSGAYLLDIGCGYGLLGILAALKGASHVDLVDSNLLAVAAAQENVSRLGLGNAQVFASDALSAVLDRRYDLVVTNPPFHQGREVDYQITYAFMEQAGHVLKPGGRLWLVANQFIRYEKVLRNWFNEVDSIAQDGRYHVIRATKA